MKKLIILAFLLLCGAAYQGLFAYSIHVTAAAAAKDQAPIIDGDLNDASWQLAVPFTTFQMVLPETGSEPSEKTELRVLYDEKNLYFGVYCYTTDPSTITVTDMQYDQGVDFHGNPEGGNDMVRILLDPFQDKRNAYAFFVTAGSARTDGLVVGDTMRTDWDGLWEAKSKRVEDGWCCEIRIPFKSISFDPQLQEWGFNFERYIAKKLETIRLSGISKDINFYNPAHAALLGSIKNIKQGLGLTFKPFAILETSKDFANHLDRKWKVNGGFDLYKNIAPNLVGVLTYHTDFAETEVDDRQINLTRFPLYFPEKRSFFLEGSDIFSFQTSNGFEPSFIPFFSRRIGLFQGEQVPIEWGVKVFGKLGRTNIALLDVQTSELNGIPAGNFAAGRISQNIFSQGKVGLIFTNGEPGTTARNSLLGFDFKFATSHFLKTKSAALSAWWVHNWNTLDSGKHYGYGFKIDYPNDLLNFYFSYNYFGDALDPGLGFLPRSNVQGFDGMLRFGPRPRSGWLAKMLRQYSFMVYPNIHWTLDGRLESSRISIAPFTIFNTTSGDELEFFLIFQREVLPVPFEVADGIIIPIDDYRYKRYQFNFHSASHRPLSVGVEYETGGFYGGTLSQLELGVDVNYKGNIKLGLAGEFFRGKLPQGNFNETVYQAKADFYLNPDLGLLTYLQYDTVSQELGINLRFKWQISPGNIIYFIYNSSWEKQFDPMSNYSERQFFALQDRGVFKIQLTWRP